MQGPVLATALVAALLANQAIADNMTAVRSGGRGCHQPDKATVGCAELTWVNVLIPASPATEADVGKVIEWIPSH